ncbi:phage tail protein, partial [Vibrio parahaemolyticus]
MANNTDKSILTAAGKALLAQLNAEEKPLIIDKMIFAYIPNRPDFPQPDDVVPADNIVYQESVDQRGRLSADSVIYSTTLTSDVGPFEFNWTGAYCSEYGVLVTIDHHTLTPKSADEPGIAGNTLVRSVVLEYKDIAEITNISVDASSWQYNAIPRMQKMDDDVAQSIIDQNGKDWFLDDGFLVTPSGSAYSIKAGVGYVSGLRVALEFDRSVQVPSKPSFIYIDAHREGTPTGEQITMFNFVVTATEMDDYIDTSIGKDVPHYVCKIAQVLSDGSVSNLKPEPEGANKDWVFDTTFIRRGSYVRALKEAESGGFKDGAVVETLGYYNAYDGGGCRYEVKNGSLSRIPEGPVTYKQFGAKGGAKEDAILAMIDAHAYANFHNLPVQGDGDSYLVAGPGCIDVKTDTDLGGSKLVLSRTGADKWINISPSKGNEEQPLSQALLDIMRPHLKTGQTYIPGLGNEHEALQSYVYIATDHVLTQRVGYNHVVYAQDSFTLLRDGNLIGQLIADLRSGNVTTAVYKPLENSTLTFENFNILLNFDDEVIPQFTIERNQVDVKEFSVKRVARNVIIHDGVGQLFTVNRCYKIAFDTADGDAIGF